ncbi:MAG: hypothetical protein AAFX87_17610 [Bacteroidota bacterium]
MNFLKLPLAFLMMVAILTSCQDDIDETIDPPSEQVIDRSSNVASLVQRTATKDGSEDNILDGASCTSIVLPVTLRANGIELTITSVEGFEIVEEIFDEIDDDEDIIEFVFPITVALSDHSELVINNLEEFENIIDDCVEGGGDDDIECLDFEYPITITAFNTTTQVNEVVTINDDEELYELIENLDEDDLISFTFPIKVVLASGESIEINNNDELETVIEDAIDDCDEDDDNDYDDDDVDDTELVETLLDGVWSVSDFTQNNVNSTSDFDGYKFDFEEDETLIASNDDKDVEGEWETDGDDGVLELEIEFEDSDLLEKLNEDWEVVEFDENLIRLKYEDDDDDDELTILVLERVADDEDNQTITEIIVDGTWVVAKLESDSENKTADFNGFNITFDVEGEMTASNGNDTIDGAWEEYLDDGERVLELEFESSELFEILNDDWELVKLESGRIELTIEDDEIYTLVLEKN